MTLPFDSQHRGDALKKQHFHLAGKTYTVKAQIESKVRDIAKGTPVNTPLTGEDLQFMRDLFTYHPQAESKLGEGIDIVVVRIAARNSKNREFWIRQIGSSRFIDISWTECLRATTALTEFRNACRLAVKKTTQSFCDAAFAASSGLLKCPLTGEEFTRDAAHVDHADPWPFRSIVDAFIQTESLDLNAIQYDGFQHGSTFITLRDQSLAARFSAFHDSVAVLRVVSRNGNLRRSRAASASS